VRDPLLSLLAFVGVAAVLLLGRRVRPAAKHPGQTPPPRPLNTTPSGVKLCTYESGMRAGNN
jgi:hypothetical protein